MRIKDTARHAGLRQEILTNYREKEREGEADSNAPLGSRMATH